MPIATALDTIQRKAARIIMGLPNDAHAAPLLESLRLPLLETRRRQHIVDLVERAMAGHTHPALKDYFRREGEAGLVTVRRRCDSSLAQFEALLTDDLWRRSAEHANRMARLLETEVSRIPGVKVIWKVEANGVFAQIPRHAIEKNDAAQALHRALVGKT